jgi:release factor glutamine methyltransferase
VEQALPLAQKAGDHLKAHAIDNGRLDAELMLAAVLGVKRLDLYLHPERPVTTDELEAFRRAVRRRLKREPLQYITGEAAFRKLVLSVDRRALIPRPETEVLVGEVLKWAQSRTRPAALDIGTGTGAIALSLALEGDFGRIVATDVSADALALARSNAERTGLSDRVAFRLGPLFEPVVGERFDVVVSNPPYVAETDAPSLAPEVRDYEPAAALFAGGGLAVLDPLIERADAVLNPGGLLALEVGMGQTEYVMDAVRNAGLCGVRTVPDLTGRPRVVLGEAKT